MIDEVALLAELISVPSVSGEERPVAGRLQQIAARHGLELELSADGLLGRIAGREPGPTLAFVSHLDTVPPGEGWSRHPYDAVVVDDRMYGRGASDAKGSVAAMTAAAIDLARSAALERGSLLLLFGFGEETRDSSMPRLVGTAPGIDAAVIGEPTALDLATSQRGLVMAELRAHGEQRHAAHTPRVNAIHALSRDLIRLAEFRDRRPHQQLGAVQVTPTMISAGVARNMTPPTAMALLDIRSTPQWEHEQLIAELAQEVRESEFVVTSSRLVPCAAPHDSRLASTARQLRPEARCYGSPTCSDWVFLRHCDAIKCGPGESEKSHQPDESILLSELRAARLFYRRLAKEMLQ